MAKKKKADDHAKRQKAEDLAKTPKADDQAKTKKRRKKAMKNATERYVKTTTTIEETVEKSNDMREDAIEDTVEKTDDVGDDEINETAPNPWIRLKTGGHLEQATHGFFVLFLRRCLAKL